MNLSVIILVLFFFSYIRLNHQLSVFKTHTRGAHAEIFKYNFI